MKRPSSLTYVDRTAGLNRENDLSPVALRSSNAADVERNKLLDHRVTSGSDRTEFEHDRDRIIHSRQFRRMAGKTQILIAPANGDLRTRLTHTLEVYQLATTLARRFNLNLPATEAMALGHDVGHTPFGHAGEAALDDLMKDIGGFHHAAHSVRSLDTAAYEPRKEDNERTCGLNLTKAVRTGIIKHGWFLGRECSPYHLSNDGYLNLASPSQPMFGSVEAQVVSLADGMAYLDHDINDLLAFGFDKILSSKTVRNFFEEHQGKLSADWGRKGWNDAKQEFVRLLQEDSDGRVKILVRSALDQSHQNIESVVQHDTDWRNVKLVDFKPVTARARELFYRFFDDCVYSDKRLKHKNEEGKECITFIYKFLEDFYNQNVEMLPQHIEDELTAEPPWWQTYLPLLEKFRAETQTGILNPKGSKIECRLAAMDVVALLTDGEALCLQRALDRAEGQGGIDLLQQAVEAFPSTEQHRHLADESRRLRDAIAKIITTANPSK